MRKIFLTLALLATAPAAFAYIGPGAGISLVGSIMTFISVVFLGLFAILAWPIRRMLKRRKAAREAAAGETPEQPGAESNEPASPDAQD